MLTEIVLIIVHTYDVSIYYTMYSIYLQFIYKLNYATHQPTRLRTHGSRESFFFLF